jgi:hypothetical protein
MHAGVQTLRIQPGRGATSDPEWDPVDAEPTDSLHTGRTRRGPQRSPAKK